MLQTEIVTSHPEPGLEADWFEFLSKSNYSSHYTSPGFFKMPYWEGKRPFALIVTDESRIVAVACGIFNDLKVEIGLPVRPQFAFDPQVNQEELTEAVYRGLNRYFGDEAELLTIFSMNPAPGFVENGFTERESTAGDRVVVIDLSAGIENIFSGLSSSRRANIRKAKRRGLLEVFPVTRPEELEQLYPIHIDWCRRKGITPDSEEAYHQAFQQNDFVRLFAARHEKKIVAGSSFRFVKGGLIEYAGNVSTLESRKLRPNDLLMWTAIEWAAGNGFDRLSMGASHPFLQRFGGTIESSYRYRMDKSMFRRHDISEAVHSAVVKAYLAMPEGARTKFKSMVGR